MILSKVCDRIEGREIWLPYGEIKTHVCKIIAKASRTYMRQIVENEQPSHIKPALLDDR
jgi:hypothetical protein